jgi:hypothetical protein
MKQERKNYSEAKVRVDWKINGWTKEYNKLCNRPRYGTIKQAFYDLIEIVKSFEDVGDKCVLSDGKDQLVVLEYERKKVKSHQGLLKLTTVEEID